MIDAHTKYISTKSKVKCLLTLPNGMLVSGSDDRQFGIKIWNLNVSKTDPYLEKDILKVLTMVILNERTNLMAIGTETSIKVMNYESGLMEKSFDDDTGNLKFYRTLKVFNQSHFLSGNDNGEVSLWNIQTRKLEKIIKNSFNNILSPVYGLKLLSNGNLVTASTSRTIRIWNKNFEILKSFQTSSGVYALEVLSNGDLASAGDGIIEIWNGVRNEFNLRIQLKVGLNSRILSLNVLTNDRLVSGGEDKALKIWEKNNGKLVQTLNGHNDHVISLVEMKNGDIASGSIDGEIGIWTGF
jgi:WD40 repeat protein